MRTRIVGCVVSCPYCAGRHVVDLAAVDRGYVKADCGRGAIWPVLDIADGAQAAGGRHRAKISATPPAPRTRQVAAPAAAAPAAATTRPRSTRAS